MAADSAPLPPDFGGYTTLYQNVSTEEMNATISFSRPFALESEFNMAVSMENTYSVLLTWGVFDNTTDTNTTYIFGSKTEKDAQKLLLLTPTAATKTLTTIPLLLAMLYSLY
jgi:hypothetical protein